MRERATKHSKTTRKSVLYREVCPAARHVAVHVRTPPPLTVVTANERVAVLVLQLPVDVLLLVEKTASTRMRNVAQH